jgi:DNA-binding NarL/FixJ family response regulator
MTPQGTQINQIRILICDDHKIFTEGLKRGLESEPDINVVGDAHSGDQVYKAASENEIDILLLDIELPGENGISITKKIKVQYPHIRVIALSMHDSAQMIQRMVKAGAQGYLLKNSVLKELIEAIRDVHDGKQYFKGVVMSKIIEFSSDKHMEDPLYILTKRELEILQLISTGKSNNEIAEELFISVHTVNSHRKNILKKLNQKNTAELVRFAVKNRLV